VNAGQEIWFGSRLDEILAHMVTEAPKSKKRGPRAAIKPKDLLDRYVAHKQFFEYEWGRIGLDLRRVKGPEGIRAILLRVPNVQWRAPFRDYRAGCLILEKSKKVTRTDLRQTRRKLKQVETNELELLSEHQQSYQEALAACKGLKSFIDSYDGAITLLPFFCIAFALAEELQVPQLTAKYAQTQEAAQAAMKRKAELQDLKACQEAWFARMELFKFTRNKHEEKSALNFARATAGLPEYSWIRSFRKCHALHKLHKDSLNSSNHTFQLFELLRRIVQSMRSVDIRKTEARFRKELLKSDPMLQATISPNWAYMRQSFAQCRDKGFKRADLPFKIMGKYLDNLDRNKTPAETELAKKNQLLST
jgi:hypothetical protein